jgi:hypothetical protein
VGFEDFGQAFDVFVWLVLVGFVSFAFDLADLLQTRF